MKTFKKLPMLLCAWIVCTLFQESYASKVATLSQNIMLPTAALITGSLSALWVGKHWWDKSSITNDKIHIDAIETLLKVGPTKGKELEFLNALEQNINGLSSWTLNFVIRKSLCEYLSLLKQKANKLNVILIRATFKTLGLPLTKLSYTKAHTTITNSWVDKHQYASYCIAFGGSCLMAYGLKVLYN